MPKDYKDSPRPDDSERKPLPGWVWLGAGLALGFALTFGLPRILGWRLPSIPAHHTPPSKHTTKTPSPAGKGKDTKDKPAGKQSQTFDFYKMLPRFEVVIPDEDKEVQAGDASVPVAKPGSYILQVGSFRQYKEADQLKAHLALLGVESQIQQVKVDDGQTWNRVRIGPIKDLKKLNALRRKLAANKIEPLLIRGDK
jgi:cell division protein FtsN